MAFFVPMLIASGSAVVTGIASYFVFRPSQQAGSDSNNTDAKGEIFNNVHLAVKENNDQNSLLALLIASLVLLKLTELIIYAFKSYQRSLKRRYNAGQQVQLQARPTQQQQV